MDGTTTSVTIPPASVAMNPAYDSDWMRALHRFVSDATRSGHTVLVTVDHTSYTPAETGQLLGLSRSTIQRGIADGTINATKTGSRYRVSEAEIARLRATRRAEVAEMFAHDF